MKVVLLSLLAGCTTSPPLVEAGPQVEVVADPGGTSDRPLVRLTLTSWVHPTVLGDAVESGQIAATLDGEPLVLDLDSGYAGIHDSYTAAFVLSTGREHTVHPSASTITVTDQATTWTVTIAGLLTNDLRSAATDTLVWPSAATSEPWSTIEWACVDIAMRDAACESSEVHDPRITIDKQFVKLGAGTGTPGDRLVITAQRFDHTVASGDGPTFFTSIRNSWSATAE